MKRKGFTLVELLVVIAIIALLMGILMPALARVRQLAFRMTCGTNLSGIGKAMLIYANDYSDELPRAGGRNCTWGVVQWDALSRQLAYKITSTDGTGGVGNISGSFYLLIKYAEVTPKSFMCKGDTGVTEFSLTGTNVSAAITDLTQAWDFGVAPATHCSYTYHHPFSTFALTTSSEPGFPVAADRNPWLDAPSITAKQSFTSTDATPRVFMGYVTTGTGSRTEDQTWGNSTVHQEDGQNVMFLDGHVEFAKRAYCGLENDNIYTPSTFPDNGDSKGVSPAFSTTSAPRNRKDAFLVHDDPKVMAGGAVVVTRGS